MSRLYLVCVICSRRQAEGLISGSAWARLELPPGARIDHPAVRDSHARACPTCVGVHPDWEERARAALGIGDGFGPPLQASA
jgi:hypothetical protein